MKKVILTSGILVFIIFMAYGQGIDNYKVKKSIIQSFSTDEVNTIIVKLDDKISLKVWNMDMVSVETSLIPVDAAYRAVEILADTGDYDVLTFSSTNKMLIYDNPNNEYVYFKDREQLFEVEYTIHAPAGFRVIDIYRNDLLNGIFAAK